MLTVTYCYIFIYCFLSFLNNKGRKHNRRFLVQLSNLVVALITCTLSFSPCVIQKQRHNLYTVHSCLTLSSANNELLSSNAVVSSLSNALACTNCPKAQGSSQFSAHYSFKSLIPRKSYKMKRNVPQRIGNIGASSSQIFIRDGTNFTSFISAKTFNVLLRAKLLTIYEFL